MELELSSFEEYLETDCFLGIKSQERKICERELILSDFPYSVILKLFYSQMDFADWLLWQLLREKNGNCDQMYADIKVCHIPHKHWHNGNWTTLWLVKTDYDYGFNEWFFKDKESREIFLSLLPLLKQIYGGYYYGEDIHFQIFMDKLSAQIHNLSTDEKIKSLSNINWKRITEEVMNETYNF